MSRTVLVTGASGYIAAHVIKEFLNSGYRVVGTVRSESTAAHIRVTHAAYAGDRLSLMIIPDLVAPGAFNGAVKDVDGVIHIASPFILNAKDFEKELYGPAVRGTLSVLQAVKDYNPQIKRVVITSSFASVLDVNAGLRSGYTYSREDWNSMSKTEVKDGV